MQALLRAARRLLVGATLLYCIGIIALAALWAFSLRLPWWLALSNTFAALLFAPLLVLVPAALAIRSWWMRAPVAAALALFLALFGARFLPPSPAPAGGAPLRVMTFNHLYTNQRADAVVAAIRAQGADVVALQELSPAIAAALEQQLKDVYPYQLLRPNDSPNGLGLISRLPMEETTAAARIRHLSAAVQIGALRVTVINVHPGAPRIRTSRPTGLARLPVIRGYDTGGRTAEIVSLLDIIDKTRGPLVVMGDFNTGDREPPYAALAARMHDAFREAGWGFGFTFPDHKRFGPLTIPFPLVRIDYVWSAGGAQPASAQVVCANAGADHCAVVADLRVSEGGNGGTAEAAESSFLLLPSALPHSDSGSGGTAEAAESSFLPLPSALPRPGGGGGGTTEVAEVPLLPLLPLPSALPHSDALKGGDRHDRR